MPEGLDTFPVYLGDLPPEITGIVTEEIRHFAVPLMLNNEFLGSGVLVEVDGRPGILTAEHVINNPALPFDNSVDSRQALATSVSTRANVVAIEMRNLNWWTTGQRQSDEWGPDLAFIRLPEQAGFTRQLRASKSFYNLSLNAEIRMNAALEEVGFMAFVGYVGEQVTDAPPESGFRDVKRVQGYAFLTGPVQRYTQGDFDYLDVGCDRALCPTMPKSFGGVSGGGIWRFDVTRGRHERPGQEKLGKCYLTGIVFRQDSIDTEKPTIRGHSAKSIYKVCLPAISTWLRG